jgi:formylglycine-generating enzyme required for sulfatase activity
VLADLTPSQRDEQLLACLHAQWQADLQRFGGGELETKLSTALVTGQVLLVFDGLDEMPVAVRALVRLALVALTKRYGALAQIIVTCRIRSYNGDTVLPGFQAYTLADFDQEKVQAFVAAWYNAQLALGRLTPERATAQRRDLQRATAQRDLRRMAVNPMLLTTMAIIHQKQTRLPDQRVELYHEAVNVLLYRWQQERATHNSPALTAFLKSNKVRPLLERLAYKAHQTQRSHTAANQQANDGRDTSTDLTRAEVLALLDEALQGEMGLAAEFLDYVDLRAGLLVGRGGDEQGGRPALYAFAHRTFQEYLAGCWLLAGREMKRNYWEHAAEGDYWQLAAQLGAEELLYNRRGEALLLDLMYHLCPVRQGRTHQARRATLWSGQMASLLDRQTIVADSFGDGGAVYLARLIKRLQTILTGNQLPAIERADAGRTLAKLGDPRPAVMTTASMQFCYVPAGPFRMGSKKGNGPGEDPLAYEDEEPQHDLDLPDGYWLARYPVTNAQFAEFVAAGGYANAAYWPEAAAHGYWRDGFFQDETQPRQFGEPFSLSNHPVVGVSWYEALAYTRWLTEQLPAGWQARLPSEAEWEKAARGGLQIPAEQHVCALAQLATYTPAVGALTANPRPARRYAWGDAIDADKLNYNETNIGATSPVGAFPGGASPYGVEELNGNVWEWTRSLSGKNYNFDFSYPYANADGREDLATDANTQRVLRGGAFGDDQNLARAAYRDRNDPRSRDDLVGVRILLSPFPR